MPPTKFNSLFGGDKYSSLKSLLGPEPPLGLSAQQKIQQALVSMGIRHGQLEVYNLPDSKQLEIAVHGYFGNLAVSRYVKCAYEELESAWSYETALQSIVQRIIDDLAKWVEQHANEG